MCYGVEKSWPQRLFGKSKFQDLLPHQKRILIQTMSRDGVKMYKKYVDEDRMKRRRHRKTELALAEYYQERLLRNRFIRIRGLGNYSGRTASDSDCSLVTVIDKSNSENVINATASAGRPNDNEANSNNTGVTRPKRKQNRRTRRQEAKPSVDGYGVSTRSRRNTASQSETSIDTASCTASNQLVSSSRIRKLRSNLLQSGHDDGDMLFLNHKDFPTGDDGIAMLVEVASQVANPMNFPDGDVECQFNVVEHIDITDDSPSSSDSEGMLIIDESFDDGTLSQITESSSVDVRSIFSMTSPRSHSYSSEFVRIESLDIRYMHESFNESVELFLSQINEQIE